MKETITTANATALADATLRKIARRVVREMGLAMDKAVAHAADPVKYPLPADPNCTERLFWRRYESLTPEEKQLAKSRVMPRLAAPAAKGRLGDLAAVDLQSSVPIEQQVDALPYPDALRISPAKLRGLDDVHGAVIAVDGDGLAPQQTTKRLELRLQKVICDDETNAFGSEIGSDDIAIAGTAIDETGDTHNISELKVGVFDDKDVEAFSPPRRFTIFDLREGDAFPKSYFVTMVLAEKDGGGLAKFVAELLDKVKSRVTTSLAAAIGAAVGTASGGPVGTLIGAAVGIAVDLTFSLLKSVFADEIFTPKTVSVSIPSLAHRFKGGKTDSPETTTTFKGHGGTYRVITDWRLVA